MKNKILKSTIIILTLFFMASCYDLDRVPYESPSSKTFWKTDEQARMGIMGVYSQMKSNHVFGRIFLTDCMTDIGIGYDYYGYQVVSTGVYNDRHSLVTDKWKETFDGVMKANNAIRNLKEATSIDENKKTMIIGEAKFLRALYYFHLLDYFGGVPIYDESVSLEENYNNLKEPRATVEKTREFIIADLTAAINAPLPEKWTGDDVGRATLGAAYALRGKVYLYGQDYENAKKDFEEVYNNANKYGYGLYPNYAEIFNLQGHNSGEMVFAIQNLGGTGTDYGMPMTFYMGTRSSFGSCWNNSMPSVALGNMYECKDGKKFNWDDIVPNFNEDDNVKRSTFYSTLTKDVTKVEKYTPKKALLKEMYENRDPRMQATLILPYTNYLGWVKNDLKPCELVIAKGVNESNGFIRNNRGWETYFWRKFVAEGNMNGHITNREHTPINFPIIRYADVLLMLAECHNQLGDQTNAVKFINMVRQRPSVNLPALNSGNEWLKATTKDDVFARIQQERAVEFAAEGIRFSDIRRWKTAESLLNKKDELTLVGGKIYTRSFLEKDYLWPVPAVEIEINDKLKPNNPGW